jgi:hypothetical protein
MLLNNVYSAGITADNRHDDSHLQSSYFCSISHRTCTIKLFLVVILAISLKARMFAIAIHFHPRLIFSAKARRAYHQSGVPKGAPLCRTNLIFAGKAGAYQSVAPYRTKL